MSVRLLVVGAVSVVLVITGVMVSQRPEPRALEALTVVESPTPVLAPSSPTSVSAPPPATITETTVVAPEVTAQAAFEASRVAGAEGRWLDHFDGFTPDAQALLLGDLVLLSAVGVSIQERFGRRREAERHDEAKRLLLSHGLALEQLRAQLRTLRTHPEEAKDQLTAVAGSIADTRGCYRDLSLTLARSDFYQKLGATLRSAQVRRTRTEGPSVLISLHMNGRESVYGLRLVAGKWLREAEPTERLLTMAALFSEDTDDVLGMALEEAPSSTASRVVRFDGESFRSAGATFRLTIPATWREVEPGVLGHPPFAMLRVQLLPWLESGRRGHEGAQDQWHRAQLTRLGAQERAPASCKVDERIARRVDVVGQTSADEEATWVHLIVPLEDGRALLLLGFTVRPGADPATTEQVLTSLRWE